MISKLIADARIEDFRREAAGAALLREAAAPSAHSAGEAADVVITIRLASADDANAVQRLADKDSAPVPTGAVLVAEADGQLRAALSLRDGAAIADPFHPTAATVQLLTARAAQLRGEPRRSGLLSRLSSIAARGRWRSAASLSRSG
jgi:hypothetical protein